ncbi:MAG TPA: pyridoxamine 5'-phosphate oxidase family protein [Streptosporangiaceae bacterium]|jgi:hypothetical protein
MTGQASLAEIQAATFAAATAATRQAYPADRQLTGGALTGYLDRRSIAMVATTRPDGRPHAALSSYRRLGATFWLPTMAGAVRAVNLRSQPWMVLTVAEGDGDQHIAVIVEGSAAVITDAAQVPEPAAAAFPRSWVAAWIRLDARRLLSYADAGLVP